MTERTTKKLAKVANKVADNNHAESDATMKKKKSASEEGKPGESPSQRIDAKSKQLSDWRSETLARVRMLIREADPEVVEEVKWRKPSNSMLGVPVWSHAGIICTGETYKNVVKMTLAKGGCDCGPGGPLQLQPRRQHQACHRLP